MAVAVSAKMAKVVATDSSRGRKSKTKGKTVDEVNVADEEESNVFFDAFELIWKKRELPFSDHLPPKPTAQAMEETAEERRAFENVQDGTPTYFKHRFFLVDYGIEMLEHYQTQRSLHIQLILYTFFVFNFLLYTWNNVQVNDAVHVKDSYLQSIVEYPYVLSTDAFDEKSGAAPRRTMLTLGHRSDILPWMKSVLLSSPYSAYGNNESLGYIGAHNRVIGAVRLKQVKTRKDSCEINVALRTVLSTSVCYDTHSPQNTDKEAFGPGTAKLASNPATMPERVNGMYSYRNQKELSKSDYVVPVDGQTTFEAPIDVVRNFWNGEYGSYEHGGFAVDLPRMDRPVAIGIVDQLMEDNWIDDSTAFVTVSMTTYNAHLNLFMYTQLYFECPPSGLIHTGAIFRPFRMPGLKFMRPSDGSDNTNRILFSLWVIFWMGMLLKKVWVNYRSLDFWDAIDLMNLLMLSFQFTNRLALETQFSIVTNFASYATTSAYVDFYQLSWLFESERLLTGANAVLVFIKYFKLTRVVVRLSMIVHVLEVAARELFSWVLIAGFLFFSFTFAAHIGFGSTLYEFHTLTRSAMTLFNYMIGLYEQSTDPSLEITFKTGYGSLDYAGRHAAVFISEGVFFYIIFNLCYYFLLTRLLVAMLISAYSRVLREIERDEEMEKELAKMRDAVEEHIPTTWHTSILGKLWFLYLHRNDEYNVLARLKSSPELIDKGYLSYMELKKALGGMMKEEDLEPMCMRLMNLQRIHLHRTPEVMGLLKQRMWTKSSSLEEYVLNGGKKGQEAVKEKQKMLEDLEDEDGMFAMENWNRDVMSGDVLHAAIFVFRNHLEDEYHRFASILKSQQRSLRQIMEQMILIEARIGHAFEYYTGEKITYSHFETEEGQKLFEEYHEQIRLAKEEEKMTEEQMMQGEVEDEGDADDEPGEDVAADNVSLEEKV